MRDLPFHERDHSSRPRFPARTTCTRELNGRRLTFEREFVKKGSIHVRVGRGINLDQVRSFGRHRHRRLSAGHLQGDV